MSLPDSKWSRLSASLRASHTQDPGARLEPCAPPGFSTRVVARARAEARAEAIGLRLWRRWSLVGACAALLACGTLSLVHPSAPPAGQIIPVPAPKPLQLSVLPQP